MHHFLLVYIKPQWNALKFVFVLWHDMEEVKGCEHLCVQPIIVIRKFDY